MQNMYNVMYAPLFDWTTLVQVEQYCTRNKMQLCTRWQQGSEYTILTCLIPTSYMCSYIIVQQTNASIRYVARMIKTADQSKIASISSNVVKLVYVNSCLRVDNDLHEYDCNCATSVKFLVVSVCIQLSIATSNFNFNYNVNFNFQRKLGHVL